MSTKANINTIKVGDWVQADEGFTCLKKGDIREVRAYGNDGFYIECGENHRGQHLLDGQLAFDGSGDLVGLTVVKEAPSPRP